MGQSSPQILVRVAPRLLSDALTVALREHGLSVTCYPDAEPPTVPEPRSYAVAVVTEALPADVAAGEVIRIDAAGRPSPTDEVPISEEVSAEAASGGVGGVFEQLLVALQAALVRVTR